MCFYVQQIADCEPPTPQNNNNNNRQQHLYYLFYYYYYWLFLYSTILCSWADSLCSCHMWFWMSNCILFIACVSNIHWNSVLTVPFGCCVAAAMYISKLTRFISEVIWERALKICMMVNSIQHNTRSHFDSLDMLSSSQWSQKHQTQRDTFW